MTDTLTRREQQVAGAVSRGLSNKQIAAEFGISVETVKQHLSSIYDKLALAGRVMLAVHMIRATGAEHGALQGSRVQ
jgi:DNA-binding NarL/FixJ family response regulator